jgi:uncharacterized protein DUF2568
MRTGRADDPGASKTWTPVTMANATLIFALEIGMLAALCAWGFTAGSNAATKILLGIGAPVVAGALWWLFLAGGGPKVATPTGVQVALKLALFGAAALALYGSGQPLLAIVFAALSAVTVTVETATK